MNDIVNPSSAPVATIRAWVEQIMGMPISIDVRAIDTGRVDIARAVEMVFTHLRRADAVFSTWDPDSEIMRLRAGRLAPAHADPWIAEIQTLCRTATRVTGGLFTTDLTGPDGTRGFDPTGLVKGWAVSSASNHLRAIDGIGFSINAGGDIVCGLGRRSATLAVGWRIGIQDPRHPDAIARVLEIVDGAMATSSNAARGPHIIDPRTGTPVMRESSSTVVGPDLMWADIWATTTFIDPAALSRHSAWADYTAIATASRSPSEAHSCRASTKQPPATSAT